MKWWEIISMEMDERARKLWEAWLDGYTLQCRSVKEISLCQGIIFWEDADPSSVAKGLKPHESPDSWRIKPKIKEIYTRTWATNTGVCVLEVCDFEREFIKREAVTENKPNFQCWLNTGWTCSRIEVEP